ncbi:MAG: histidinol-phosphate transaminase [Humidesulfovibrio sp.]|uniref:histidinol-phosphate transaminase n=1 Tax=Humidesulfovibrio sp. TaxID=2910988 RepID=UPI002734C0A7|nr:histidinol-phosphate transaminase [Humidesulfovibrio sp.]MDP2848294.1 histidinol-phosphate transaminase [Humidesulfovibrio sp.]
MSSQRVRPEILDFTPYVPGLSVEEIKAKYGLPNVIKLASNENPLGVSPLAQEAMVRAAGQAFRYPQNHSPRLTAAIGKAMGVPAGLIVAGNGSDEIIDLLFRVLARPGKDNVVCYEHCFSMYGLTSRLCGVEYREVPRGEGYRLPLEFLAEAANENTVMVFVTTPDNPTGLAARAEELMVLSGVLPKGAILVVDEAYMDFSWPPEEYSMLSAVQELDNVVVLRTFSKAYGLAGLRLGYGVMPQWLADHVRRARPPFTVNLMAEEAGLAVLEDDNFYSATLEVVFKGRERLLKRLPELGCEVWSSQANFVMFRPPYPADQVCEELLRRGVIVRHLKSFGLPDNIRVNVGTGPETEAFLKALEEILHG